LSADIDQLVNDASGNGVTEMVGSFLKATCNPPAGPGTDWQY
jgi:hypothetical protein